MGILGALPLTGKFGAIVMQDNGFGNALTALTTFNLAYHLPLLIVANTRGGLGEYNSMIHTLCQHIPTVLNQVGVRVFELDRRSGPEDWQAVVTEAGTHARMTFRPVVGTCAATSRELAAVADRPNHLYLLDSMGLAGSVATGIALGLADSPIPKVVAIEGDGSLLMNPNVLPTGGYLRPTKLIMVLLDNAVYGSTANLPTYSSRVDLGELAAAAGWTVRRAGTADALRETLTQAQTLDGPVFLHVGIEPGNAPDVPKLLEDPVLIGRRFADWLASHQ